MTAVALTDVADVNPRVTTRPRRDDLVAFVPMAELNAMAGTTSLGDSRPFSEVSKGYTVFEDGDLLVAKITPCFENNKIGQARLSHPVGVGSSEFHVVRPNRELLHDRYLLHFLRQNRVRVNGQQRMTGSGGQRRVPPDFLRELQVPLPPLDEQRRIAAILDQADGLRAKRRRVLAHLDQLPLAIFFEMFGSPDDAVERVPFGEVARLTGGRNIVADDAQSQSAYRVLKISSVTTGHFKLHESKPLPADYVPPESHLVRRGDLLMSRANTTELVGAVALVHDAPENLALPDKIWKFDWRDADSVPAFYHALFRTPSVRRQVSRLSSGTGGSMKNVSKGKLETMLIPDVPTAQQRQFAKRVDCVTSQRALVERAIFAEEELFASLQSKFFGGKL